MGCLALVDGKSYTDFIAEIWTTHNDDDAWGMLFGYDGSGAVPANFLVLAHNDNWADALVDGAGGGPFIKIKATNGLPCLGEIDAASSCYHTLSYSNSLTSVVDGEVPSDLPSAYYSKYPYEYDTVWPDSTMTLVVKNGHARVLIPGPDAGRYIMAMTFDLESYGYRGGAVGIFTAAHQMTVTKFTITDLSNDANLPTAYCDGVGGSCDTGRTGLCLNQTFSPTTASPTLTPVPSTPPSSAPSSMPRSSFAPTVNVCPPLDEDSCHSALKCNPLYEDYQSQCYQCVGVLGVVNCFWSACTKQRFVGCESIF